VALGSKPFFFLRLEDDENLRALKKLNIVPAHLVDYLVSLKR
jgi:hypothetical protein